MLENLFPQKIFTERRVLNVDNDKEGSFCMDFHLSIKSGNKILDLFRKHAFLFFRNLSIIEKTQTNLLLKV